MHISMPAPKFQKIQTNANGQMHKSIIRWCQQIAQIIIAYLFAWPSYPPLSDIDWMFSFSLGGHLCWQRPNPGVGRPHPGFGRPNPGFGHPNPRIGRPSPGFVQPNPDLDIQILDLDIQTKGLDIQMSDLDIQFWELDFRI